MSNSTINLDLKKKDEDFGAYNEQRVLAYLKKKSPYITNDKYRFAILDFYKIKDNQIVKYYEEKYDMTLDVDPELLEPNSLDEEEKESLSIEDVSEKYKINKNLVNTLISKKPKRGPVEVQKPFREDPIDLITDQMLADSGYIDSIYAGALPKALAKRKFIKDFYNDLGN